MNNKNTKTDLAKLDALGDGDIVYDEDTGAPFSDSDIDNLQGFTANGIDDLRRKTNAMQKKISGS